MSHWREPLVRERHRDFMTGAQSPGGAPIDPLTSDGWVYFVRACSFTFSFAALDQLRDAIAYFGLSVHAGRRRPGINLEHYWQEWHERLPAGLNGGSKRLRVLRTLHQALRSFVDRTRRPSPRRRRRIL
jgi:hypothetical protein